MTTTDAGQFVLAIAIVETFVEPVVHPSTFTFDHDTFGNGYAHLTSNTAPAGSYQAEFTQNTAGHYCAVAAVFD